MEHQIFLKHEEYFYNFFSVIYHPNDASIMVCIKVGDEMRINYHATGQVNYHSLESKSRFNSPSWNLSTEEKLIELEVPDINCFKKIQDCELTESIKDGALDISISNNLKFSFTIRPTSLEGEFKDSMAVSIGNTFLIALEMVFEEKIFPIVKYNIPESRFAGMQAKIDESIIKVYQRMCKTDSLIIYPPNGQSVIKIIPSVPKRIVPTVKIEFMSPDFTFEQIYEQSKNYRVAVDVRGKGKSKITSIPAFKFIEIDAEL